MYSSAFPFLLKSVSLFPLGKSQIGNVKMVFNLTVVEFMIYDGTNSVETVETVL